jgi:hypothetical protein
MTSTIRALLLSLTLPAATSFHAVAEDIPRPEHPRPDLMRTAWLNLNGIWEFAETDDESQDFSTVPLPDKIVVPFCRESKLSGLEHKGFIKYVWYRRSFTIPSEWSGKRVLLHFGACDWEAQVWVNGQSVGSHRGGSTPFTFDITSALVDKGENTVLLKVYDDHRTGLQGSGKQSERVESYGCMYTRTTGIWQTVWLEAVPQTYIENYYSVGDPVNGKVALHVCVHGPRDGVTIEAQAYAEKLPVAKASVPVEWGQSQLLLNLTEKHPWSVEDPFLYTLKLRLVKDGKAFDEVESYFGLRKVEIQGRVILLNGKPVFQRLVLDQGFYPEGIWTAPSDAALEQDIKMSQAVGFNGARLHQKVFEPRFLYHADRLGYLVWGEYPNWGLRYQEAGIDEPLIREWQDILGRDRNHPAIIGWCPFNETPPEALRIQNIILDLTRRIDPTRPLLDSSGWTHTHLNADVCDAHDYNQDPVTYKAKWDNFFKFTGWLPPAYNTDLRHGKGKPFFVSEFGGIGWTIGEGWGYGNSPKTLEEFYQRFEGLVNANLDNPNFLGYCYTQLTDVEQERNGIYTYTREPKFDANRLKAIQARTAAYETSPPIHEAAPDQVQWKVLISTAHDRELAGTWKYTFDTPVEQWNQPTFDDQSWKVGEAGFGNKGEGHLLGTEWTTTDIWLRREFEFTQASVESIDLAAILIWFDNKTEVYLNGTLLWEKGGWNNGYEIDDVTTQLKQKIHPGKNLLAVHTHQDEGGQYIDVGLFVGMK